MIRRPATLRALFGSRLFFVPAGIYLVLGFVLAFLPLTDYLGLEFSLAVGIVAGLLGGPLAIIILRRATPSDAGSVDAVALWAEIIFVHGAATCLSLVGLLVAALWTPPCSPWRGAGFFVLLPLVTVAYAGAWGLVFGTVFLRTRCAILAVFLFSLLTVAWSAARFVAGPAVWFYNTFFGYFPGPIYDAAASPSGALLSYRLLNLAVAGLVVVTLNAYWARRHEGHWARPTAGTIIALIVLLGTAIGLYSARFSLGFDMDEVHLRKHLDGHLRTEHFDIYYPRRADIERQIRAIAADHEFFFAQIERELGLRYPHRIASWIYPSESSKKDWIGAGGTELARGAQHQMHLNFEDFPIEILHHEMIHVMLSDYGLPVVGFSPRIALTEGIAVAFGGPMQMDQDLDRWAAGMKAIDRLPRIPRIMGFRFWADAGSRSYTAAGSFIRYLARQPGGGAKLLAAYRWGDLDRKFGRSLAQLEKDWLNHLTTIEATLSDAEIARAQHRFGAKSIFEARCPREIGRLTEEADRQLSRNYFHRADLLFQEAAQLDKDDIRLARRRLVPLLHTEQLALAEILANDVSAAQGTRERPARNRDGQVVGSQIIAQQADAIVAELAWRRQDIALAKKLYERILAADLLPSLVREAACAQYAFYHGEVEAEIRNYLTNLGNPRATRWLLVDALKDHPDDPVLWYLTAKRMLTDGAFPQTAAALQRALALGLPHPALVQEAWSALGYARFMDGDLAGARAAYLELRNLQGASDAVLTTEQWLARIDAWPNMLKKVAR